MIAPPAEGVRPSAGSHPLHRHTPRLYSSCRHVGRTVGWITVRAKMLHQEIIERPGPVILAPTHISHLEPFILSMLLNRHIDWMSRIEFYRYSSVAWFLDRIGAFPVRRQGVPVSAIRTAIHRLGHGRSIGIFPEGGVSHGSDSLCRGGAMKRGACLIAYRTAVPVVPCVVIGTHRLNQVGPWIPWGRAKLWIAFGEPVLADRSMKPREARAVMAAKLQLSYQHLFRELVETFALDETCIP